MSFEDDIKNRLLMRGFSKETLINNRGLIGATIEEVIVLTVKNLDTHSVSQQRELLLAFIKFCHSDAYSPEKTTFKEDVDAFMEAYNCG